MADAAPEAKPAEEGVPPADAGEESDESGFGDSDDDGDGGADEMMMYAALSTESAAREGYTQFLAKVPLLSTMAATDLDRVADMVTAVTFADGDVIMQQGDEGDSMYILQEGKVAAEIEGVGVVKEYSSTEYFGEVALVRDGNQRAATVKSVGASSCLRLGKKPFAIVLAVGSIGDMLREHVAVLLGEGPAGVSMEDDSDDDDSDESGFGDSDDEGGGDSAGVSLCRVCLPAAAASHAQY